jgi:hypothetical protein
MLSGLVGKLALMRGSVDALRVVILVVGGVAAGYFWRAAFEAPTTPAPRVAAPITPKTQPPTEVPVVVKPKPVAKPRPRRTTPTLVAERGPSVTVSTPSPVIRTPRPRQPAPRPTPPTAPPPPSPTPPTQTPTTSTPPVASPPALSTPAPTVQSVEPSPPPPTTGGDDQGHSNGTGNGEADKPGWGHGDKNHDHTGPKSKGG